LDVDALDRDIQSFHQACEQRQDLAAVGERIAESLLKPFASVLEAHAQLIVVPHGSSHLLPVHALPWKGKPLSATHTVTYLPSASVLQFRVARKAPKLPDSVLAVGNPAAMVYKPPFNAAPEPLPSLPAAGVEAMHVAQLFPKGLALVGKQATAEAVRRALPRHRILHFATHGHLSEDAPLMSSILLANGESLTLDELIGLSLDADLVVLSACRTGQGKNVGGDEVIGLTRGLLAAGARAVVVSLWAVDDLATSLLMGSFYSELRQGKLHSAALQSAQNTLRTLSADAISTAKGKLRATRGSIESTELGTAVAVEDYSHPHFWAPFVFVG
jgi:CHAT domain-containing protein